MEVGLGFQRQFSMEQHPQLGCGIRAGLSWGWLAGEHSLLCLMVVLFCDVFPKGRSS